MKFMADMEDEMSSRFEQESQASSARRAKKPVEDVSLIESELQVNIPTRQRQDMREYQHQSPTPHASNRQQTNRNDY